MLEAFQTDVNNRKAIASMVQKITDKYEKILKAAEQLFEANGFHATGVEAIASVSGVTKRTLYKHFGSKEGLIEAVLRRHHDQTMDCMRSRVAKTDAGSGKKLLVCLDLYQDWFFKPCFAGCIFIKTLNEFQQGSEKLFTFAAQTKADLHDYITEIAREENVAKPERLADQLQLILEGSIVVAQCGRKKESVRTARELAENLISQALV